MACLTPTRVLKLICCFSLKGNRLKQFGITNTPIHQVISPTRKPSHIRFEEFEPEQAWWDNREENEFAWKVSVEEIKANNYNLDIKNPHRVDAEHADLDEMLEDYQKLMTELNDVRSKLKFELMEALNRDEERET